MVRWLRETGLLCGADVSFPAQRCDMKMPNLRVDQIGAQTARSDGEFEERPDS
jgi:hypothetical protein